MASNATQRALSALEAGRVEEAEELLTKAVAADACEHAALNALAIIADMRGDCARALKLVGDAVACSNPARPQYLYNLGTLLFRQCRYDEAEANLRRAIDLDAKYDAALNNLGALLTTKGRLTEAEETLRRTLALNAGHHEAHNNLGNVLKEMGKIDAALASYREAVRLRPDYAVAWSNLLMCLHYRPGISSEELLREHRAWHPAPVAVATWTPEARASVNERDGARRLRVGYVSADFRTHSVAYFFEPLLDNHDRDRFDIWCYYNGRVSDATTERLRRKATRWRQVQHLPDTELAGLIAHDGIDILVDLSGHSGENRLGAFALRPAPVQVTYLGYPGTTGLDSVDGRLTDGWADPDGHDAWHSENLVRLDGGFLCYLPPRSAPAVSPLPMLSSGHVTFGSFNTLPKVNIKVVEAWSAVLRAVPGSCLVVKCKAFNDTEVRERYRGLFAERGITGDRLSLEGHSVSLGEHLAAYGRIDVALDTFPYNGTTTTCEALWMGVPVVVLEGQRHASRVGVSLLSTVGLKGMIAPSLERYVALAVFLASDAERLSLLRSGLRGAVARSSLCDGRRLARRIEDAYQQMWHERGEGQ